MTNLERWLIEKSWRDISRLWSIRIAVFWGAVSGLFVVWPAFQDALPRPYFAVLSILMSVALVIARITKQTGGE